MFEILPNPSLEIILVVARALLLIGAFWVFALAFMRWRRADERQAQQLQAQLALVFAEVRSVHETVTVLNARIEALAEREQSQPRLAPAGAVGLQRGYDLAARLAKNGAAAEELTASCGITRHEAELLVRLHAAKVGESLDRIAHPSRRAVPARPDAAPPPRVTMPSQPLADEPAPGSRRRGSLLSIVG